MFVDAEKVVEVKYSLSHDFQRYLSYFAFKRCGFSGSFDFMVLFAYLTKIWLISYKVMISLITKEKNVGFIS